MDIWDLINQIEQIRAGQLGQPEGWHVPGFSPDWNCSYGQWPGGPPSINHEMAMHEANRYLCIRQTAWGPDPTPPGTSTIPADITYWALCHHWFLFDVFPRVANYYMFKRNPGFTGETKAEYRQAQPAVDPIWQPIPVPPAAPKNPWPQLDPFTDPFNNPLAPTLPIARPPLPYPLQPYRQPNPDRSPSEDRDAGNVPRTNPLVRNNPQVVPTNNTRNDVESSKSPGVSAHLTPTHSRTPPGPGVKEKKATAGKGILNLVRAAFHAMTEACDAVEAIYDALPSGERLKYRPGKPITCHEKALHLAANLEHVDIAQAIKNLILNGIEDKILGTLFGQSPLPGRNFHPELPPGLEGGWDWVEELLPDVLQPLAPYIKGKTR